MPYFSFSDSVEIAGVARARFQRFCDAGIIRAAGGGSQGKPRRFSMRNLVEGRVCDICRELELSEQMLRRVVQSLNDIWDQPDAPLDTQRTKTFADVTVLWIEFAEYEWADELRTSTESSLQQGIDTVAAETKADPKDIRAKIESEIEKHNPEQAALVRGERSTHPVVAIFPLDDDGLIARVTGENADSGIVIQLARIIREIEAASGETFDPATTFKRAFAKALANKDQGDE